MRVQLAGILLATLAFHSLECFGKFIKYNTTSWRHPDKLNVHIISHSHDDAGWLKTVDQYFYGGNQSIQVASVQMIIDSVLMALQENKDRQFTFCEMAFFTRWWSEASEQKRAALRDLFASGQASVWNGGWVQHDEAAAHYTAMIDQTTRGHRFLKSELGFIPSVGFQADPFGHSSTNAVLTAMFGMDGTLFGRADYQDVTLRRVSKETEMVWRGSESLGPETEAFTVNLDGYWPIPTFWWDWGSWDEPIKDDPSLSDYNVESRLEDFLKPVFERFGYTRGNDIILTMGSDFHYANAFWWYQNLDKLIHYANLDGRVNVFYSNASYYFESKAAYNVPWPLKTDDFFPYADSAHSYWTGYFTSRPTSKGFIRSSGSWLSVVRQLEVWAQRNTSASDALEAAVSLTQHHDSVTGTEKQHVANDYHQRLYKGLKEAQQEAALILKESIAAGGTHDPQSVDDSTVHSDLPNAQRRLHSTAQQDSTGEDWREQTTRDDSNVDEVFEAAKNSPVELEFCNYLNASICGPSVSLSRLGRPFVVVAYNPLAWSLTVPVRVPIIIGAESWAVTDDAGEPVAAQFVPISSRTLSLQQSYIQVGAVHDLMTLGDHEIVFKAKLPPVGYVAFTVNPVPVHDASDDVGNVAVPSVVYEASHSTRSTVDDDDSDDADDDSDQGDEGSSFIVGNDRVQLTFSRITGQLESLTVGNISSAVRLQYVWYKSSDGSESEQHGQCSGAYIFRPQEVYNVNQGVVLNQVVKGPVLTEIRQTFADWAVATLRLWHDASHVEVEWTVGPIPIQDKVGKEISLQYITDVDSGDVFYTDSNGRDMLKRVRNARPTWEWQPTEPTAGNYYPLTAAIYIEEPKGRQLSVTTERAQGGASLSSGVVEVMVHRRTVFDDWRGVAEAINETECNCRECSCEGLSARGTHYVALTTAEKGAHVRRSLQQMINDPPQLAIGALPIDKEQRNMVLRTRRASGLASGSSLPANVHLLTLMPWAENSLLIRLAHLYQVGEDTAFNLSKPVTVALTDIVARERIALVSELSLSGNQCRSEVQQLKFEAGEPVGSFKTAPLLTNDVPPPQPPLGCKIVAENADLEVTLNPMEIRTFEVALTA